MKPNASLKSRNTNFLVMASRSLTSLQPASLASGALRPSLVSFCPIVLTLINYRDPQIAWESPPATTTLVKLRTRYGGCALRGVHALVREYRHDRRYGGPRPHHIPAIPGLDFRRR